MAVSTPRAPFAPRLGTRLTPASPDADQVANDLVLEDALWQDAALGGERLEFAELATSRLAQGDCSDTDWYRCSWVDVDAEALDLANALFTESLLRRVVLDQCRLTGVGLSACTLEDVTVRHSVVDLGNLKFAKLTRVHFDQCQLTSTDLANAELTDVSFEGCDLTGAQFSHARCRRVRLAGCRLDGVQGVDGLRGATIAPLDLLGLAHQLADAMGIGIDWDA